MLGLARLVWRLGLGMDKGERKKLLEQTGFLGLLRLADFWRKRKRQRITFVVDLFLAFRE